MKIFNFYCLKIDQLYELIPTLCIIFFSEFFIDWVKHGFVLKFNDINESVFYDYKLTLANDLMNSRQKLVIKYSLLNLKLKLKSLIYRL